MLPSLCEPVPVVTERARSHGPLCSRPEVEEGYDAVVAALDDTFVAAAVGNMFRGRLPLWPVSEAVGIPVSGWRSGCS